MKDKNGVELKIGDYVRTRECARYEYLVGKIIYISRNVTGKEYAGLHYVSILFNDDEKNSGWWPSSLTKIDEEEAMILILKGNI
jgi:hypothetical protein